MGDVELGTGEAVWSKNNRWMLLIPPLAIQYGRWHKVIVIISPPLVVLLGGMSEV